MFMAAPSVDTTPPANDLAHVAIIMDGNGRWATSRGLSRPSGHQKGAENAREMIKSCIELNVPYLTLYAFSSENWNRSPEEIEALMMLLRFYLGKEIHALHKGGVRISIMGDRERLSADIQKQIHQAETLTQHNTALHLTIALSYGSRQEITAAIGRIAEDVKKGVLVSGDITETMVSRYLYTASIPDPDLLIRTGGEQRLSNFLLWQAAYTELYFTDTLWPDFTKKELEKALAAFHSRERRYGTA